MIKTTLQKISLLISTGLNALFIILLTLSINFYPGGSRFDKFTEGYSLIENFISDLGRVIAINDHVNTVSKILFIVGIMCFSLAQALLLINLPFILNDRKAVFILTLISVTIGIVYVGVYIGIAFNPYDVNTTLHNKLIYTAAPMVFVSSVFLTIAMFLSKRVERLYSYFALALLIVFALFAIATGIGSQLDNLVNWRIRMLGHTILIYTETIIFIMVALGFWNILRKTSKIAILDIDQIKVKT